jgi:hypothetical protein
MQVLEGPALTAGWLNGWLAAIGATVLAPQVRLAWTTGPNPHAVFTAEGVDPFDAVLERFPTLEEIERLAIARSHPGARAEFTRKVDAATYGERAALARSAGDFSLWASVTDLATDQEGGLAHSPFDPPVPKGLTLFDRLRSCRELIVDVPTRLRATFEQGGIREQTNGLGFDYRRIVSPTDPNNTKWADPVGEVLAFFGMAMIPVRAAGTGSSATNQARARGWTASPLRAGSFRWPVWREPLSAAGIDALLDVFWSSGRSDASVTASYESVAYQALGTADTTRGFGSRRGGPR